MSRVLSRAKDLVFPLVPPPLFMRFVAWQYYLCAERDLRILPELIVPGKDAIDIGANYGVYSHYLSKLVPHVYAYEPNPGLAARLRRAVAPNVDIVSAGLSDATGTAILVVPLIEGRELHGHGTLESVTFPGKTARVNVDIRRLDDAHYTDIGFIKIDVEGHEESVLRGGLDLIQRCRPRLLIEIEQHHLQKSVRDVLGFIESLGYRACVLRSVSRRRGVYKWIHATDPLVDAEGRGLYANFIFIPTEDVFCARVA